MGRRAPGSAVCNGGNFCLALPLSRGAHAGGLLLGHQVSSRSFEQDKILRLRAQAGERVCIPWNAHAGTTWKPSPRFQTVCRASVGGGTPSGMWPRLHSPANGHQGCLHCYLSPWRPCSNTMFLTHWDPCGHPCVWWTLKEEPTPVRKMGV